jgi:hypothetical protein
VVGTPSKPQVYRDVIDALVDMCKNVQGRVGPDRARRGVWNQNASADFIPDQHEINLFLRRLSPEDRETLARMLEHQTEVGVHQTLAILGEHNVEPFGEGYEGAAYNDFVGRMQGWKWPSR